MGLDVEPEPLDHDRDTLLVQRGEAVGVAAEVAAVGVVQHLGRERGLGVVQADVDVELVGDRLLQPGDGCVDRDQRAEGVEQQGVVAALGHHWPADAPGCRTAARLATAAAMLGPSVVTHQVGIVCTRLCSTAGRCFVAGELRSDAGVAP